MKKLICVLVLLLVAVNAHAYYYIFNTENRALVKIKYSPNIEDLESRGEFAVYSKEDHELKDIEYRSGKIRERVLSQQEKNEKQAKEELKAKIDADKNSAKEKLKILGLTDDEVEALLQ